jgi:hypothetical protein
MSGCFFVVCLSFYFAVAWPRSARQGLARANRSTATESKRWSEPEIDLSISSVNPRKDE